MMMVLEKVSAIATQSAVSQSRPIARISTKPMAIVKASCPRSGGERHRPDVAHVLQIELEPHQKQQYGHADLGQEVDLIVGPDQCQPRRAHGDAYHNVGDQHGLAQPHRQRADGGGDEEQGGNS